MSAWFKKALKRFADGGVNLPSDTIKLHLYDVQDLAQAKAITGATNATPISIASTAHGLTTGDEVSIHGVGGNTNANGHRKVTVTDANNYTLQDPRDGTNIAGNGAYTSGGFGVSLEVIDVVTDLAGAGIVGRSPALGSKTTLRGVFDAADTAFTAVTGDQCEIMFLVKDTGADGTSPVLAIIDSFTSGMPVTPNGGDINVTFAAAGIAALG